MSGTVRDAYVSNLIRVDDEQRPGAEGAAHTSIYAVFEVPLTPDAVGRFLGLVTARDIALFPHRIFADLLPKKPYPPLPADATLSEALEHLQSCGQDLAPVLEPGGDLSGVVTHASVLAALFGNLRTQTPPGIATSGLAAVWRASRDPLTGLTDRAGMICHLESALRDAREKNCYVGILLIGLDRFSQINNALGRNAGDQILREMGLRLHGLLREDDCVARIGGDEFGVVLPGIREPSHLDVILSKIAELLARPLVVDGKELVITASMGFAVYPSDGEETEQFMESADVAMRHAKTQGRNILQRYAAEMNVRTRDRLEIENGLRRALEYGELLLHYQPQINTATQQTIGVEALLRWRRGDGQLVPPGEFIPLAEETGLIERIGEWVLREACRQARRWRSDGYPHLRVAVNVSARQFARTDLADMVLSILEEVGLDPSGLELEITESALVEHPQVAAGILSRLHGQGVRVSIDDFGTGYSSLSYLKRFPIDCVKIDRSFVNEIAESQEDAAIATAIVQMSQVLGLSVIAEGVETAEQMQCLRNLGCEAMQGYLFGRPSPIEEVLAKLSAADVESG